MERLRTSEDGPILDAEGNIDFAAEQEAREEREHEEQLQRLELVRVKAEQAERERQAAQGARGETVGARLSMAMTMLLADLAIRLSAQRERRQELLNKWREYSGDLMRLSTAGATP